VHPGTTRQRRKRADNHSLVGSRPFFDQGEWRGRLATVGDQSRLQYRQPLALPVQRLPVESVARGLQMYRDETDRLRMVTLRERTAEAGSSANDGDGRFGQISKQRLNHRGLRRKRIPGNAKNEPAGKQMIYLVPLMPLRHDKL
jgi:hypothetical protein